MLRPSPQQVAQLRRDNAAWPVVLREIPREDWPRAYTDIGNARAPIRVLRNRGFLVQVFDMPSGFRLSVCRTAWDSSAGRWQEHITWDDLERLKSQAGYGDRWAVEIFPPDDRIVNEANMRHLWLLPAAPAFGWNRGDPSRPDETGEAPIRKRGQP